MQNHKDTIKIIAAIIIAFVITIVVSNNVFQTNNPQINKSFFDSFQKKAVSAFVALMTKPVPTPTTLPTIVITPVSPSATPNPTNSHQSPTKIPTRAITPTKVPTPIVTQSPINTPTPSPTPTTSNQQLTTACPATSSQQFSSVRADHTADDMVIGNPDTSPEINLRLRGFTEVNEGTNLISRNGNAYGLDPQMPPQISSLYGGAVPQIAKTYRIYEWDFTNNKTAAPQTATPQYPVHMLGLQANPGQPLLGLKSGRTIDSKGDVFMVVYATDKDIVFSNSNGDTLLGGYLFYFLDVCVDPNLLSLYQKDNSGGRSDLPAVGIGQQFATAGNTDVKVVVRDTMSFMDTRYKQDWWSWNGSAN